MDQASLLRQIKREAKKTADRPPVKSRKPREDRSPEAGVRVIAVTSGKGGVGKTQISANLACGLAKLGKKTLLLDADMGLANVDIILGLTPQYNLHHVLQGRKTLQEVLVTGPGDIRILPAASGIQELAHLTAAQKLALMDELNGINGLFDYVLIDTAAGITGNVMYFNMAAKEIVVVVSPEPTSLTDAYALIKLLYQGHREKRIMLLVNMVKNFQEAREVYMKVSRATEHFLDLTIEFLGHIVDDGKVAESVRRQKALVEIYPDSPASECILAIARKLTSEPLVRYNLGSMKFFSNAIVGRDRG